MATCINLGLQTLEGISDLHALGYLHRDIKPQNFTVGLREKSETIFLLDFGIARRYTEKGSKAIRYEFACFQLAQLPSNFINCVMPDISFFSEPAYCITNKVHSSGYQCSDVRTSSC